MAEEFDAPQSRNEAILQNMLGAENELPAPQSRIEELLQQILEQGSGGGKKYVHNIYIAESGTYKKDLMVQIISSDGATFDRETLAGFLVDNGFNGLNGNDNALLPATGWVQPDSSNSAEVIGIFALSAGLADLRVRCKYLLNGTPSQQNLYFETERFSLTDTVYEI